MEELGQDQAETAKTVKDGHNRRKAGAFVFADPSTLFPARSSESNNTGRRLVDSTLAFVSLLAKRTMRD